MAIQSARSEARTHLLEGAILNALVILLVASVAAVLVTSLAPQTGSVDSRTSESRSLVDFRAGERGALYGEQRSLIDFRAGERP